jgi:phosphate transport system permease protein
VRRYTATAAAKRYVGEWIIEHLLLVVGLVAVVSVILVLLFMLRDALPLFFTDRVGLGAFLTGTAWGPDYDPPLFGIVALVAGTLIVTFGASLLAIPIGFACAVYLAEIAPRFVREILKPTVEMLAAIPSVVMGFVGLIVLNPIIRETFHLSSGLTALTASIMLALMAMPTIISIAEDAISAVPHTYREGSLALGASKLATIRHAVLPAARSGLVAAAMLGIGRALGETMTVLMVAGNTREMPLAFLGDGNLALLAKLQELVASGFGFFGPVRTMTATLAVEMGEAVQGDAHYHALFAVGALLCLISFAITFISDLALRRTRR